ncbi:threonine-phosphate decarboxylase CobD [Sneathiella chinensis]|uniref:threonine-phosphate decarboxylase n=1 Tax=Sneathiella chinensis TaxID=349750 RepID=A0ABQ5U2N9_9PROT|nr:threonine-phosphate decarboxylase CobD [Sneathiella chinensis]GLQ06179.1 threonine-phosphate decarboxylase [Sneathiella chinensis]
MPDRPAPNSYNRDVYHGGDLAHAKGLYGQGPDGWLDLSTGINPVPYPIPDCPEKVWHRLPESDLEDALLSAARRYYSLHDEADLVALPGTQAALQLLPLLRPMSRVDILGPTYAEHGTCWRRGGHHVTERGTLDQIGRDTDVAVIVNPNNPDGRLVPIPALQAVAKTQAEKGGWTIIDEAFMDVMPENSLAGVPPLPGTVILKSIGKFFGLAGLRLGFAMGDPALIRTIREHLGPWAVSGIAAFAGKTALSDTPWITATRQQLAESRTRLATLLDNQWMTPVGGTDLFTLVETHHAATIFDALCTRHILIRPFPERPQFLRFGLPGSERDWRRLETALEEILPRL